MWLRISGICGILTPVVALLFISLAIASYPFFSWIDNALSDLGLVPGVTAQLFNFGIVTSGILSFISATGIFLFLDGTIVSRTGAFLFVLTSMALTAIGVFPEDVRPTHYLVSVAFFVLLPISMLFITVAFWLRGRLRMAVFMLVSAFAAAIPWVVLFVVRYVSGVAIPEAVSALAGSVWIVVLGPMMLRHSPSARIS
jgi:hypothetical membrane protein